MNRHEPPRDIDAHVRDLFAPDPRAVARVLARVRGSAVPTRHLPRSAGWLAGALTLLVLAVVWRSPPPVRSGLVDSPLAIEGDRELVVVERASDGQRWAVVAAEGDALVGNYVIALER